MKNNYIKNPFLIFVLILIIIIIVIIIYHNNILSNRNNLLEKFVTVTSDQTATIPPPVLITNPIESSDKVPILKHMFLPDLVGEQFIKDNNSKIGMGGLIIIKKKDRTIYILSNIFSLILLVPINDCTGKEMKKIIDLDWEKDDSIYFPNSKEFKCKITNNDTIVSPNTLNIKEGDIKPGSIIMTASIKDKNFSNLEIYIFCIKSVNIDTNNITITLTSIIPEDFIKYVNSENNVYGEAIVDNVQFTVLDFIL